MGAKFGQVPYIEEYGENLDDIHNAFHTLSIIACSEQVKIAEVVGGVRALRNYLNEACEGQFLGDMKHAQTLLRQLHTDRHALQLVIAQQELRGITSSPNGRGEQELIALSKHEGRKDYQFETVMEWLERLPQNESLRLHLMKREIGVIDRLAITLEAELHDIHEAASQLIIAMQATINELEYQTQHELEVDEDADFPDL